MGDRLISEDERRAYSDVAGLRKTIERVVKRQHDAFGTATNPEAIAADVEVLWVIVVEAYSRGVASVHRALHRGEGLDREMIDQAFDHAIGQIKGD